MKRPRSEKPLKAKPCGRLPYPKMCNRRGILVGIPPNSLTPVI